MQKENLCCHQTVPGQCVNVDGASDDRAIEPDRWKKKKERNISNQYHGKQGGGGQNIAHWRSSSFITEILLSCITFPINP